MDKTTNPIETKKVQQRNLALGGLGAFVVIAGLYYGLSSHVNHVAPKGRATQVDLATPLAHVDPSAFWLEKAQNELAAQARQQDALNAQLDLLKADKRTEQQATQTEAQEIQALKNQVALLQKSGQRPITGAPAPNGLPGAVPAANGAGDGYINNVTLHLTPPKGTLPPPAPDAKTPATYVPAGTFVTAVTIGGADASAAVTSQGDPTPMLYRLTGEGTLPNQQHSTLSGCFATAAAIGDISSERGQVRLERLSCVAKDGATTEIPVEATVFGPDGKDGVRGNALWREGALLERAFVAGTLSGLSNGISQGYTTTGITPLGGQTSTVNNGKIMQYGLASGVGNAAEKLADYNIQRAEQYHPVIQLSAGTVVDIVFLKGFYLDGKKHPDDAQATVTPSTPPPTNALSGFTAGANAATSTPSALGAPMAPGQPPAPLPLSPAQISALQQKLAAQAAQGGPAQ